MNNNEDNLPGINKFTIIQNTPCRNICTGCTCSYFKVSSVAFAFETLHYPWIPSCALHLLISLLHLLNTCNHGFYFRTLDAD